MKTKNYKLYKVPNGIENSDKRGAALFYDKIRQVNFLFDC